MTLKKVFLYVFISLLLGLLTTNIVENKLFGLAVIFFPMLVIFWKVYYSSEDKFDFLLFIFILSHFTGYVENQGGLWVIMTLVIFILNFKNIISKFLLINNFLKILIIILFSYDILGLIFVNEMKPGQIVQYFFMFTTLILIFIFASSVKYSEENISKLFKACFILAIYSLIIALNQKYMFIPVTSTPLFPLRADILGEYATERSSSMINDYELFAEYSLLTFILFFPNIIFKNKSIPIKYSHLIIFSLICITNIFLSGTRSTIILIIASFILYGLISIIYKKSSKALLKLSSILLFFILVVFAVGIYIGTDTMFERFSGTNLFSFSLTEITEGKGINREEVYLQALYRINESSWQLGFGFGTLESNRLAWFGKFDSPYFDYHNLYLSLPIIFGWGGAVVFLFIIFTVLFRLLLALKNFKNINDSFIANILIGLIVFWISFLINEYKISILRNLHYIMLIFIWLGISNSLANTSEYEEEKNKL